MSIPLYQVDAFTDRPFAGNPAAVCLLPEARPEAWMQDVAAEMNLSETAFLVPQAEGFDLRWYTPVCEIDLCGHATLASAHALWESGTLPADAEARFHTQSGLLRARRDGDWIELDFPADPVTPADPDPEIVQSVGCTPVFYGRGRSDVLIALAAEEDLRALAPDFTRLAKVGTRGICVTAPSSRPTFDFVSRFFAPAAGINEDPVTGSAHCTLACYWRDRLGRSQFVAFQASSRGGTVRARVDGERVKLGGQAVTVFRAALLDA